MKLHLITVLLLAFSLILGSCVNSNKRSLDEMRFEEDFFRNQHRTIVASTRFWQKTIEVDATHPAMAEIVDIEIKPKVDAILARTKLINKILESLDQQLTLGQIERPEIMFSKRNLKRHFDDGILLNKFYDSLSSFNQFLSQDTLQLRSTFVDFHLIPTMGKYNQPMSKTQFITFFIESTSDYAAHRILMIIRNNIAVIEENAIAFWGSKYSKSSFMGPYR